MFGYSHETMSALLAMILTGALSVVYVDIYFKLGFGDPLLVTILYSVGSTLALVLHVIFSHYHKESNIGVDDRGGDSVNESVDGDEEVAEPEDEQQKRGSCTGLTAESALAVQWIHSIPTWCAPIILGSFNIVDTLLRFLSYLYMPAVVSEILFTGFELVVTVLATRIVRKRLVSKRRWLAVGITFTGLVLVGCSGMFLPAAASESPSAARYRAGLAMLIGKTLLKVMRDLLEELFLQETGIPVLFLSGAQGFCGVCLGAFLYFLAGPSMGYKPVEEIKWICQSNLGLFLTIAMLFVFLAASVSTTLSTAYTSSMSRNMWKNFRGLVVFAISTLVFYCFENKNLANGIVLGDEFKVPSSIVILLGFSIMMGGLYIYYTSSSMAKDSCEPFEQSAVQEPDDLGKTIGEEEKVGQGSESFQRKMTFDTDCEAFEYIDDIDTKNQKLSEINDTRDYQDDC